MKKRIMISPVYFIVVAVVALIALLLSNINCIMNNWINDCLLSFGIGALSSGFVAFIIELGNSKRKVDTDKKIKEYALGSLKDECINLTSEMYTAVYESIGFSEEKYSFDEWCNQLFDLSKPEKEKQIYEIEYMLQTVSEIKEKASKAKNLLEHFLDNSQVDREDFIKLQRIISLCDRIKHSELRKDFGICKSLILNDLKPAILQLYPDLNKYFTQKYNEDDFC